MGIGDIGVSLWGECEVQNGMHLGARGFVHAEIIDPETEVALELEDGVTGELGLTHLQHRAAPLLRFRTRDHVLVRTSPCPCGRTGPRVSCIGRTDDMLIIRGVNVFPSAVREVVSAFAPEVSGHILLRPQAPGVKQEPPLPVSVELARGAESSDELAEAIRDRIRNVLIVQMRVDLVEWGSLQRSEYKSKLVERQVEGLMRKLQSQGVHHITIVGADRQTSIDFWEGVLGMPFVFEQPNLDNSPRAISTSIRVMDAPPLWDRPIAEESLPLAKEDHVPTNTLSILKPSVNNLTTRIFVRAVCLEFEELDVWGRRPPPSSEEGPGRPDAAARRGRAAEGLPLGELRDHAVPLQQARTRPLLSDRPG